MPWGGGRGVAHVQEGQILQEVHGGVEAAVSGHRCNDGQVPQEAKQVDEKETCGAQEPKFRGV